MIDLKKKLNCQVKEFCFWKEYPKHGSREHITEGPFSKV
jgi:hypothetical protein